MARILCSVSISREGGGGRAAGMCRPAPKAAGLRCCCRGQRRRAPDLGGSFPLRQSAARGRVGVGEALGRQGAAPSPPHTADHCGHRVSWKGVFNPCCPVGCARRRCSSSWLPGRGRDVIRGGGGRSGRRGGRPCRSGLGGRSQRAPNRRGRAARCPPSAPARPCTTTPHSCPAPRSGTSSSPCGGTPFCSWGFGSGLLFRDGRKREDAHRGRGRAPHAAGTAPALSPPSRAPSGRRPGSQCRQGQQILQLLLLLRRLWRLLLHLLGEQGHGGRERFGGVEAGWRRAEGGRGRSRSCSCGCSCSGPRGCAARR